MNKQEAIAELKRMASTIEWDYPLDAQIAIEKAVEALSGPTPDPETGLVPCGCGGELELRKRPAMLQETKMQYWVVCRKCHWSTMDYLSKELAVQHANRAMGFRGEETP